MEPLANRTDGYRTVRTYIEQFALTEASYVTVRLVQQFPGIESRDPEPWREKLTLTCTVLGGCKVGLFPFPERETVSGVMQ